MTDYYVDDGGDGTTERSWATADTSINALDTEYALASGDIVYFGHDHVCQATNAGNLTIVGPQAGAPCYFISATQGSNPPTYAASSTAQIDTTEGAYDIVLDGSFAMYGIKMVSGDEIRMAPDNNEQIYAESCTFAVAADKIFNYSNVNGGLCTLVNCTIDLTADGTTNRATTVISMGASGGDCDLTNISFVNPDYRTGTVISVPATIGRLRVSGGDFSGFVTGCEIVNGTVASHVEVNNILTSANWVPILAGIPQGVGSIVFTNCGPADAPTYLYAYDSWGITLSASGIYRTGGATVETEATSWLITTAAAASEGSAYRTPWIYGLVNSTGSKNFDLYITNDTADFTDGEVWLEVDYLATADEANYTFVKDQRATITTTAAAQDDDTTSTWNGSGPSYTYKQRLRVTATVGETGLFRARVAVGVASIASSRYFYVDPAVTVS